MRKRVTTWLVAIIAAASLNAISGTPAAGATPAALASDIECALVCHTKTDATPFGASSLEIPLGANVFATLVGTKDGKTLNGNPLRVAYHEGKRYLVLDGTGTSVIPVCGAWNSPAPTLSRNLNMSFGTQVLCNVPIPVKAKSVVYSGPDDNHLYDWQADTGWKFGVTTVWAGRHDGYCVVPLSEGYFYQWQLLGYALGDTDLNGVYEQFYPYPGDARKPNECADMV